MPLSVALQVLPEERGRSGGWADRLTHQIHACLRRRPATLAVVAGAAGGNEVLPFVRPASMARHHVVEGQLDAGDAAVLAALIVSREDLFARQSHARARSLHRRM